MKPDIHKLEKHGNVFALILASAYGKRTDIDSSVSNAALDAIGRIEETEC